jgi:hypothetical protein
MTAIREGSPAQIRQLLPEHPKLLAEHGVEMLKYAAELNRVDVLPIIVEGGIDVNAGSSWRTPLCLAAGQGALDAAQWLLDHGADVNGRAEPKAPTPLHDAITEGRLEMVKFLLERGADSNALFGNPARNAFAAAAFWGKKEIVAYLEIKGLAPSTVEPALVDVESPGFMSKGALDPAAWFDKKWWHVYEYATRRGIEALSDKNRTLFFVGYLIDQLSNGGAFMVYYNPSGAYTPQIAAALEEIGAHHVARIIREINRLFPDAVPATDHELRRRQIEALPKESAKLGAQLEQIFNERLPNGGDFIVLRQLYDYYNLGPAAD